MASGRATSEGYQDEHWDHARALRGDTANYIELNFDVLLDPASEDLLSDTAMHLGALALVNWTPHASGTRIPDAALTHLERVWKTNITRVVRPPRACKRSSRTTGYG